MDFFKTNKFIFLSFVILIIFTSKNFAQTQNFSNSDFPSDEPLFTFPELAEKSILSGEELISASLIFSLCPKNSQNYQQFLQKYKTLESQVKSPEFLTLPESERAEKILTLMYEKILTNYSEFQTKTDEMFENGSYNCVSASILYLALAKSANLNVRAQKTPSHAFCSVYIDGKKIDVETTNPYGFNPGTKKAIPNSGEQNQYAIIPAKNYQNRTETTDKDFLTLIANNLFSFYSAKDDYSQIVSISTACLEFLKNEPKSIYDFALSNFYTICTNYAIFLCEKNQFQKSTEWLAFIEQKYGNSPILQENFDKSAFNGIAYFINADNFASAQNLYNSLKSYKIKLSQNYDTEIQEILFAKEIQIKAEEIAKSSNLDAAKFVQEALKNPLSKSQTNQKNLTNLQEIYWLKAVVELAERQEFLQAAQLAAQGLKSLPTNQNLKTIQRNCLQNHAAKVHNQIVPLVNSNHFDEALKILQEGLNENPTSTILKNDLQKLQNAMKN